MEKGGLKIKLKISSTPEPPADMEIESTAPVVSEEEEEEIHGEENVQNVVADENSREKSHKKSKKKKKKKEKDRHKHKRDRHAEMQDNADAGEEPFNNKKFCSEEAYNSVAASVSGPASPSTIASTLRELLNYLNKQMEKKDVHQFFIEPVTDAIAPGYSSIISQPMCFASMRDKIAQGLYSSLAQYESDVKLIVSNCLLYNGPDTVYYSAGKKLLAAAQSILSKEKLYALKKDIPNISLLSADILGFSMPEYMSEAPSSSNGTSAQVGGAAATGTTADEDEEEDDDEDERGTDSQTSQDSSRSEGDDDDEEQAALIVAQATQAARNAARALHNKKPTSTMGYLKPQADGKIGLTFLSGCEGTVAPQQADSKPLNLGLVVGKLAAGSATLHNYHDDKRTMAKPVKPVQYGLYSSFCPSFDSTFSNLSKEESDLVRATYGNETALQYTESICDFSRDCPMAITLVDQLLNLLTSGQHSKTRATIQASQQQQQQLLLQQQQQQTKSEDKKDQSNDIGNLRTLGALGIDVSFLDTFENLESTKSNTSSSGPLSSTAELVQSLAAEQNNRLSKYNPMTPMSASQPSPAEIHLAERLQAELVSVAKQLPPSAILPTSSPSTAV